MKTIASIVWAFSEWSGIGLGRFAPYVFHKKIGCHYRRIK